MSGPPVPTDSELKIVLRPKIQNELNDQITKSGQYAIVISKWYIQGSTRRKEGRY